MYTPRRNSEFKGCGQFNRGTLLFSEIQRRPEAPGITLNTQFHCGFDEIPIKLRLTGKFRLICNSIKS